MSHRLTIKPLSFDSNDRTINTSLFQNDLEKIAISYELELSNEWGDFIIPATPKDTFLIYSGEQKIVSLAIPAELNDGRYILRMNRAAVGGSASEFFERAFFESTDSILTELSADSFYSHSSANIESISSNEMEGDAP